MARKVKFALEMADGTKVRNSLEELREHFDMESIISYYLSGKLLEWLEDRYYDDEAAKIEELDKDSPNLKAQLCAIIGVDASDFDALDVEALERLNEKKVYLRQKTSDESIIENAMITAITQQDLADLLDLESPVIYLCGEKFNIPIRMERKKYIGVLGTPKIEIRANSIDDLNKRDIIFENVILPWTKQISSNNVDEIKKESSINQSDKNELYPILKTLFDNSFGCDSWLFLRRGWGNNNYNKNPDTDTKNTCTKLICRKDYTSDDIIHMCMDDNFSVGFALTYDSICTGGKAGKHKIFYKDIESVNIPDSDAISIKGKNDTISMSGSRLDSNILTYCGCLKNFLLSARDLVQSV